MMNRWCLVVVLCSCAAWDDDPEIPAAWHSGGRRPAQMFVTNDGTSSLAGWYDLDSHTGCAYLTARATFAGCPTARLVEAAHQFDGIDYLAQQSDDGFSVITHIVDSEGELVEGGAARLANHWRTVGSLHQLLGMRDRALDLDCHGYVDPDGEVRCLPAEPIVRAYLEPGCAVEAGTVPITLREAIGVDLVATQRGWQPLPMHYEHAYRCDQHLPRVYHREPDASCVAVDQARLCSTLEADLTPYARMSLSIQGATGT